MQRDDDAAACALPFHRSLDDAARAVMLGVARPMDSAGALAIRILLASSSVLLVDSSETNPFVVSVHGGGTQSG